MKLVLENIKNTCLLFFILLMLPPVAMGLWKYFTPEKENQWIPGIKSLDLYGDHEWSDTHFQEFGNLNRKYQDFIVWRVDDFKGQTINIKNGIRSTSSPIGNLQNEIVWFFGGSTTWGFGVNDSNTYPSIFARTNKIDVVNNGEIGYTARQSLAFLQNKLITGSASKATRIIVFYDGVNDVSQRCRKEITGLSTSRQPTIQVSIDRRLDNYQWSYKKTFEQVYDLVKLIVERQILKSSIDSKKNGPENRAYVCDTDIDRAQYVARSLVETWKQASYVAKANGDKFYAILQPQAFGGTPKVDYLNFSSNDLELKKQYLAVYPLIREYAREEQYEFFDLTNAYDNCDSCYIDFNHTSPQAHQILVEKMNFLLEKN